MNTYSAERSNEGVILHENGTLKAVILRCPNHPNTDNQLEILKRLYPEASDLLETICCCDSDDK